MFLPCEDNLLRNMTLDRYAARVGRFDMLPRDIESALTAVIELEISLQRRLEDLKRDMEYSYDYSASSAFGTVDRYRSGVIDSYNCGTFLRSCGHYASEMELLAIIRRIDTDGDARVNYSEFSEFVRRAYPSPNRGGGTPPRPSSANRTGGYSSPLKNTSMGRSGSANRTAGRSGSPIRESPPRSFPSPGPRLRPSDEDELIHSLKDLCNNEQDLERAKIRLS